MKKICPLTRGSLRTFEPKLFAGALLAIKALSVKLRVNKRVESGFVLCSLCSTVVPHRLQITQMVAPNKPSLTHFANLVHSLTSHTESLEIGGQIEL